MPGERQSTDNPAKDNCSIVKTGQGFLFQNKHKVGKMYIDPKCVFRHNNPGIDPVLRSRSSLRNGQSSIGHSARKDEELVMHMSNVPTFLQRAEKRDSVQGKALNFGVLDWKKLETWKYNERMPKRYPKKTTSSSNSISSITGKPKMSPNLIKPSSQNVPDHRTPFEEKQPVSHVSRFLSSERRPVSTSTDLSSKGRNTSCPNGKKNVDVIKSKEKQPCNQKSQSAQKSSVDNSHQKLKFHDKGCSPTYVDSNRKKCFEKNSIPRNVMLSSEFAKHKLSPSSHNKSCALRESFEMTLTNERNLTSELCFTDPQTVLLAPKHSREGSFSGSSQVTESGNFLDEQLAEAVRNKLHDFFSPQDFYYKECFSRAPHSCPLPSGATTQVFRSEMDKDSCPTANSLKPMKSEGKKSSTMMQEKTPAIACEKQQPTSEKGKSPSPSHRPRFNFRKMNRSFSFKENAGIPQMNSTYITVRSGPVRTEDYSSNTDHIGGKRDQEIAANKGRSSPLRRLLDPLLKHKVAKSTETVQPSKGMSNFTTFMKTHAGRPAQDKKPVVSVYHALVHLTLKNGLCFFKFVVDNNKDNMLAAAVKRLPTTGKSSDPCLIYTFYSVNEVKKKSMNWISQGSKSKSCKLGYNAVAQMIISSSNLSNAMECVLYGAVSGEVNEETHDSAPNNEIAAVVVKHSNKNVTHEARENRNLNNTVLILPGGCHGLPVKGEPTSLVSRWKSNGICDCGGWDVGCKLRVLTDSRNDSNIRSKSTSISLVDLFQQGEKQKRDPLFSLELLNNGYYSVALDASISFLEAFATCVAYITCHKFPDLIDSGAAAENLQETLTHREKVKEPITFQGQIPAKYFTCPPLSPVGRI